MALVLTPAQEATIDYLRIVLGDSGGSVFYPILTDDEYYIVLEKNKWDENKSLKQLAFAILFYLVQTNYRERTSDIEVWNNASIEYRKALGSLLDDLKNSINISAMPWAAGIDKEEMRRFRNDPNAIRHPLAQIGPCTQWWTRVKDYDCICGDVFGGR